MARIALTRNDETEFVPEAFQDLPDDQRPKFRIVPLTGAQRHEVNMRRGDAFVPKEKDGEEENEVHVSKWIGARLLAARYGLRGWSGVEDQEGKITEYPGSPEEAVNLLPTSVAQEIGQAIIDRSNLTQEQRGN